MPRRIDDVVEIAPRLWIRAPQDVLLEPEEPPS